MSSNGQEPTINGMSDEELGEVPPDHVDFRLLRSISKELDESGLLLPDLARREHIDPASLVWASLARVGLIQQQYNEDPTTQLFVSWQDGFAAGLMYALNRTD